MVLLLLLYFYDKILRECRKYLNDRFLIAFEIGYDQAEEVKSLLKEASHYSNIQCIADLGGNNRVVTAVYEG